MCKFTTYLSFQKNFPQRLCVKGSEIRVLSVFLQQQGYEYLLIVIEIKFKCLLKLEG